MPEIVLTVDHKVGLHARPAALFAKTAGRFDADVRASYGGRDVNAKSILQVLTLGAEQGAVIDVRAEGEDADVALEALRELVESNFEAKP
jgi:phosphotransferase system HPr (HPr) family protein